MNHRTVPENKRLCQKATVSKSGILCQNITTVSEKDYVRYRSVCVKTKDCVETK